MLRDSDRYEGLMWAALAVGLLLLCQLNYYVLVLIIVELVSRTFRVDSQFFFAECETADGEPANSMPIVELNSFMLTSRAIFPAFVNFNLSTGTQIGANNINFRKISFGMLIAKLDGFRLDKTAPTVVIIPGFPGDHNGRWAEQTKAAWKELDKQVTVVVVDWDSGNSFVYDKAATYIPLAARQITIFLSHLAHEAGTSLEDENFVGKIHLVGHSLGAQIAGFVGRDLKGRVGRIVGLDVADASWSVLPTKYELSKKDAKLVQVIHTNVLTRRLASLHYELLWLVEMLAMVPPSIKRELSARARRQYSRNYGSYWCGTGRCVGHFDYYALGGSEQPGYSDLAKQGDPRRALDIYLSLLRRYTHLSNLKGARKARMTTAFAYYNSGNEQPEPGFRVPVDLFGAPEANSMLPHQGEMLLFPTNSYEPLSEPPILYGLHKERRRLNSATLAAISDS